jgi:hypothetical protein
LLVALWLIGSRLRPEHRFRGPAHAGSRGIRHCKEGTHPIAHAIGFVGRSGFARHRNLARTPGAPSVSVSGRLQDRSVLGCV